ncbi:MAG: hypothetical protein KDC71_15725 [Acidobacteria bacterium]|nr:hypothetical protein [Acidobacteriota bacterium]
MQNFYQAPTTAPQASGQIWQHKKSVVLDLMSKQAFLPKKCYKCNESGSERTKRFIWIPAWCYLFLLGGILLLLIPYLIFKKEVWVHYTVCQKHRTRHLINVTAAWLSFIGFFVAAAFELPILTLLLVVSMLVFLVLSMRALGIQKVKGDRVWINGTSPEFRQGLPPYQG